MLTRLKAGLNDPERPVGSLLFVGPTGVGKTELAKRITTYMFGASDRMIRFDMSEFMLPGSAGRLLAVGRGVPEGQAVAVQRLARQLQHGPVVVGDGAVAEAQEDLLVLAVDLVAHHGVAQGGQMHADLVVAAGEQLDVQPGVAAPALDHTIPGPRGLAHVVADGPGVAHLRQRRADGQVDQALVALDLAVHQHLVLLGDGALLELLLHGHQRRQGLGHQQHAAGLEVEAVHQLGHDVLGGVVEVAVGAMQLGDHRPVQQPPGRVAGDVGRLVDADQPVVLEQALQLEHRTAGLGQGLVAHGARQLHPHHVALQHLAVGPRAAHLAGPGRDGDQLVVHELAQARARTPLEPRRQEVVEAQACLVGAHLVIERLAPPVEQADVEVVAARLGHVPGRLSARRRRRSR